MTSPSNFGLPEYEELAVSTCTIMVYTNIKFDRTVLFENLEVAKIDIPLTKKQKNIDRKKLTAPNGAIIGLQKSDRIRGVCLRKKKKKWCIVCQPMKKTNNKDVKINTVTERFEPIEGTDFSNIWLDCSKCNITYRPKDQRKIEHFPHQLTFILSIGDRFLNIMMFEKSLKIAGCKNSDDAIDVLLILWENMQKIDMAYSMPLKDKIAKFELDTVMLNVGFSLGFSLDREKLNKLMNRKKYKDRVSISKYESTEQPNVKIKMFPSHKNSLTYECLYIPEGGVDESYLKIIKKLKYKTKKLKEKITTFITFSSSQTILTGGYGALHKEYMKDIYNFFIHTTCSNREFIEEYTVDTNVDEEKSREWLMKKVMSI